MRVAFPSPAPTNQPKPPRPGLVPAVLRIALKEADCLLRARRVPLPCDSGSAVSPRADTVAAIGMSYRPVRSPDQGRRSVCTYCFIVSYVGVAYPPAEWP